MGGSVGVYFSCLKAVFEWRGQERDSPRLY